MSVVALILVIATAVVVLVRRRQSSVQEVEGFARSQGALAETVRRSQRETAGDIAR